MSCSINKLGSIYPDSESIYFFDTNIWIAYLQSNFTNSTKKIYSDYLAFFDSIIELNNNTDPKLIKKCKYIPKIAITSMLISELINSYLRKIAMPAFITNHNGDFKRDYRENIHSDYDKQLNNIVSNIKAFESCFVLLDDDFNELNKIDILSKLDRKTDYNDLYFCALLSKKNIPVITHDKDFIYDGLTVYTTNNNLIRLSQNK